MGLSFSLILSSLNNLKANMNTSFTFFEPKEDKRNNVTLNLIHEFKQSRDFEKCVKYFDQYIEYLYSRIEEQNKQIQKHMDSQIVLEKQVLTFERFKSSIFVKTHPDSLIHLKISKGITSVIEAATHGSNLSKWIKINSLVLEPLLEYLSHGLKTILFKKNQIWNVITEASKKPNSSLSFDIANAKKECPLIKFSMNLEKSQEDSLTRSLLLYWIHKKLLSTKLLEIFTDDNMKNFYRFNSITMTLPFLCEELDRLNFLTLKWFE